jgi:hypothetical protein
MAQYREKGTKKKYEASIITRNNIPGWYILPEEMTGEDKALINNSMEQYVSWEERWNFDVWTFWKRTYSILMVKRGKKPYTITKTTYYCKRATWVKEWSGTLPAVLRRIKKYYRNIQKW